MLTPITVTAPHGTGRRRGRTLALISRATCPKKTKGLEGHPHLGSPSPIALLLLSICFIIKTYKLIILNPWKRPVPAGLFYLSFFCSLSIFSFIASSSHCPNVFFERRASTRASWRVSGFIFTLQGFLLVFHSSQLPSTTVIKVAQNIIFVNTLCKKVLFG